MKKICFLSTLVLTVLLGKLSVAQDFSNKGKDFWVGYGYHQAMTGGSGGSQDMRLYFAADQATNVTVSIPGLGYTQNYFVPANSVIVSNPIPKTGAQDARLTSASTVGENKGIHITSDKPIVAYAHVYNQSVSGATILFPTNTLGRDYYSVNYTNISNSSGSNGWFYVVATDPGTTTVEITPSQAAVGHTAGVPFVVTLTQGQVYNVMGTYSGNSGSDLTGSTIKSINTGSGCKRIGVFSGSGRISITCDGSASSSDNYMVQAVPKTAWGRKYLTTTAGGGMTYNIFRICVSDPSTVVTIDGFPISLPLQAGFYYETRLTNQPMKIEADKPILVAQYFTSTQNVGGCLNESGGQANPGPGDPEVLYLSPVEQNISKVLWNAPNQNLITEHYFNAVIPNGGTGLSSFRLDGAPLPIGSFTPHPQDPNYSYVKFRLTGGSFGDGRGQHIIQSDSGFNAIAYGFGSFESYGYNAGTNIKDIYQFVSIQNHHASVNIPATCKGQAFEPSMTFPYEPTRIQWIFGPALNAMGIPDQDITSPGPPTTSVVNGRTLYTYKLAGSYTITAAGTYPIKIIAENPTPDGCGGVQEIEFDLQVYDPPTTDFTFTHNGCLSSPVQFNTVNSGNGRTVTGWEWNFGDATNGTTANPSHSYTTAGTYTVKHSVITDIGCISNEASHDVTVSDPPVANFAVTGTYCVGNTISFADQSTILAPSTISKWTWNFGDATPAVVVTAPATPNQTHVYTAAGNYTATLMVETAGGCKSTVFSFPVVIKANPVANFNLPIACLPTGAAQFNDMSTAAGGTINQWAWDFGDATTATTQNPLHNYTTGGPFNVTLTVTTADGCVNTKTQPLTTVYAEPQAAFNFPAEVCLGNPASFTDISTAANSSVTGWSWDFGDGSPISTAQNPTHTYTTAGTYTVKLNVTTAAGCQTVTKFATHNVVVNPLPTISFTNSTPVCANSNVLFTSTSTANAGAFTTYSWTVNTASQGGNTPTLNYTPTAPGVYTIGLTATTDKGCFKNGTSSLTVNPKPTADFALPTVCLPAGTANFSSSSTISSGSITSYAWNFGDGNTATTASATNNYTTSGPFTVSLEVTSNSGCKDTKTQTLSTVYAEPQAAFNFPAEVCLGNPASFTDISTAANSSVTNWTWDFGDGSPVSNVQNPSHTYATAGTYTVTLNVRSAAGCQTVTKFATHNVVVNPLPTISFTNSTPVCENSNVLFTSTSTANAGAFTTYSWTVNTASQGGNTPTLNYTPTAPGVYTIGLTATTDKGCFKNGTSSLTVNPKPTADFALPTVCLPAGTANFSSSSTISSGSITSYAWNFGDGNTATTASATNNYTTTGPFTVSLEVTSNNGCKDTKTQTLSTVYAEPQAAFTNPAEVCLGNAATFTDQSSAANSSVTNWTWDFGDGSPVSNVQNPSHTYATAGTYTVTLNVRSAAGCQTVTKFATHNITVNPLPSANFNTITPGCVGKVVSFSDASVANAGSIVKWTWNFGDGNAATNPVGGTVSNTYANAGNYNVTLQVETDKGCISTVTSKPVEINVLPNAEFLTPDACTSDVAAAFTDQSTVSNGSVASWAWNFGDANANAGNPNTSTAQNATHQFTVAGAYTITLVATSDKGCTDDQTHSIFVNSGNITAGFTVANPTTLCSNKQVSLTDGSTIDIGKLIKQEIYWDYTNDPTIKTTTANPTTGATYTHTYPEFFTPASKTVTIRYVVYSGTTCLSFVDRQITLLATPQLQFTAVPGICEDAAAFQVTQARLINTLPGAGVFSGAGITSGGNFTPAVAGVGPHPITYTYTGTNGCINSITNTITVNPKPALNAGPDKFILEGGSVVLTPALNANIPVTYLWTPSTGLSSATAANPIASPPTDITYTVLVTSDKGCTATDDVFVKVLKKPLIPNIFSPNGDGIHDRWVVPYLESYPGCTIDIYNRYGQLVYHSVGYATAWDGKANGKDVPVGTYYYVIDPKNGREKLAGYVDVIR